MQSGGDTSKASGETGLSTRKLAESHTIFGNRNRAFNLSSRLRKYRILMQSAYKYFRSGEGEHSHAAEWVLDNYYIIQQAIRQVHEDMPGDYYRQLPVLKSPVHLEPSRVFSIAWEIIQCSENQLDMVLITRFVRNYQKITPLTMGELWAIPTMLRFGILEKLFQLISSITGLPCEGICDIGKVEEAVDEDEIVAGCIQSLRMFATQDWKDYFEKTSLVEGILRHDPSGDYTGMDFHTRNSYRLTVEEIASESGLDELRVAQEAIRMTDEAGDDPRCGHVGFFLHTREGRKLLEDRLGYSLPAFMDFRRMLWEHASEVYAGSIALIFLIFLLCMMGYALISGAGILQIVSVLLLCLLPALAAGVDLVNTFLMHNTTPRRLPRMDFSRGIPPEYRTMVVIPTLLSDPGDIHSMIRQLERHFLANRDKNLTFAVLSDFADAPKQQMPGDGELLELAYNEIERLNRRYHRSSGDPFYQFHRRREWNPGESCWMGWERKRGKLMEFNRLLRGKGGTSYDVRIGELRFLPDIRYVITLDADTSLPQNCGRRLVSTMAHPLNRALLDRKTGRLMNGYTVLQPRILTGPSKGSESLFTRTYAGDFSIDLYSNAVSDVYEDLFGEGNYVGKGIYDVEAFDRCLEGRIPENTLLSHDLFEGIYGRAGLVTDIVLYEDFPPHYLAWTNRLHRWIRGDWQLLPWLRSTVPDATGSSRQNDLSFLDQWKIIDNLRRSLLSPALLVLLVAGWLWLPGSPLFWTFAVLLIEFRCPLTDTIFEFFSKLKRKSSLKVTRPVKASWLRSMFALVFLLYETSITIDAIVAT
ncbi:MAG: cellobiose phosphorylase, partial [Candidatus Aegiribacteria sp.]|nr:cellobiose phosphorylase [Candidatus Aegiribacteria sp.]